MRFWPWLIRSSAALTRNTIGRSQPEDRSRAGCGACGTAGRPEGVVHGVFGLTREPEGAGTEADGAGAAAHREGDAEPGIPRVGDITVRRYHGGGPRHLRKPRRVVVQRGHVGDERGERATQDRTAGPRPGSSWMMTFTRIPLTE